jgi:hypothetical protein
MSCDLAMLTVDDDAFWEGIPLLQLSTTVPQLDDTVTAVGYPMGGDNVCVTRGVVSRIDLTGYSESEEKLLVVQIDAAINPGNSGGPVFGKDNLVAGVAFAGITLADNIGFVIPHSVVRLFLDNFKKNRQRIQGLLPSLGIALQPTDNICLRKQHGLAIDSHNGMVVVSVSERMPAGRVVEKGDVLLKVDGHEIGEDGTVKFRGHERLPHEYLVTRRPVGDMIELELMRKGETITREVALVVKPRLVPATDGLDAFPSYLIVGGLVFMPLTAPGMRHINSVLHAQSEEELMALLGHLLRLMSKDQEQEGDQVLILAAVLSSDINIGYEQFGGRTLDTFNGERVPNLKELAKRVHETSEEATPFLNFTFDNGEAVLETKACREQDPQLLDSNYIGHWCSADMDPVTPNRAKPACNMFGWLRGKGKSDAVGKGGAAGTGAGGQNWEAAGEVAAV